MNVLEIFKNLFMIWQQGIAGVNITEILIALNIFIFFLFLEVFFRIRN